jgi:hypothetical protein
MVLLNIRFIMELDILPPLGPNISLSIFSRITAVISSFSVREQVSNLRTEQLVSHFPKILIFVVLDRRRKDERFRTAVNVNS